MDKEIRCGFCGIKNGKFTVIGIQPDFSPYINVLCCNACGAILAALPEPSPYQAASMLADKLNVKLPDLPGDDD